MVEMAHVTGWEPGGGIHFQEGPSGVQVAGHQIGRQDLHFPIHARRDGFFFVTYDAEFYSWQNFADVTVPSGEKLPWERAVTNRVSERP